MRLHLLLWLLFASDVLALQCYTTDVSNSSTPINQSLVDCEKTFDMKKLNKTQFKLKCFTLSVPAAKPEMYFKGCFAGGCDIMKREVKRTTGYELDQLDCMECRDDGCNEAIPTGLGKAAAVKASALMILALTLAYLM